MKGKATVLAALASLAAVAGCVMPGADVTPSAAPLDPSTLEPLTDDVYTLGEFIATEFPSHDGIPLHVDLQLPNGSGPFPVLVQFTPYSSTLNAGTEAWGALRGLDQAQAFAFADTWVPKGYATAVAHVRGSGQSGGCFDVGGPNDGLDGYALVEWLAEQPWSNGKVALMGTSYVGTTPLATAVTNPPHLTTIVPVSAVSEWYRYYFENGEQRFFGELPLGVVYTDHPLWAATGLVPKPRNPTAADPVANAQCGVAQMQNAWLQDDYNDYWMARNYVKDLPNATAPMLYAHGFLDENTPMSLADELFDRYPGEKRLWLQQHGHGVPGSFEAYHEYVHRWLDHHMLGRDNGALAQPAVVIQSSDERYHTEAAWPPASATSVLFHLGSGSLDASAPADGTASYLADAANLTFVSEPLAADMHVSGIPRVELVAASDATDTQWDVQLFALDEDDTRHFVTRGYLDARHRSGLERGADVVAGSEDLYLVTMHGRDHVVTAGQRLLLVVASVDAYVVPDAPGATNTLALGAAGSRLVLPVVEVEAADAPPAPWA